MAFALDVVLGLEMRHAMPCHADGRRCNKITVRQKRVWESCLVLWGGCVHLVAGCDEEEETNELGFGQSTNQRVGLGNLLNAD
jgi:hypothetical protein